ncbi:hypothetical protein LTR66_011238 [Elasticomyces elasticus]|nr:hypothetical protein LTR66_011238 [Elasticomyces elasticus]
MTRTLPWAKGTDTKTKSKPERSAKRQRAQTPNLDDDLTISGVSTPGHRPRVRSGTRPSHDRYTARVNDSLPARTPSTSPPPAPPDEEFMRDGYAADDMWVMVEDEFLETAQLYTQHLHHAEYQRLKKLAKAQKATDLQPISRPVDQRTTMSAETERKIETESTARKIDEGMRNVFGPVESEEDEDDDPWLRDPQLAGLMTSPRKPAAVLSRAVGARSHTRAAAGFSQNMQSPNNRIRSLGTNKAPEDSIETVSAPLNSVTSDDDDDLDAPKRRKQVAKPAQVEASSVKGCSSKPPVSRSSVDARQRATAQRNNEGAEITPGSKSHIYTRRTETTRKIDAKPLDTFSARTQPSPAVADLLARRKAARERKEKEQKKGPQVTEIPTFLI